MRKSWLVCVLMGTMAWGQAQAGTAPAEPSPTPAAQVSPAQSSTAAAKPPAPPAELPENTVVLTITGVCPATPKTATSRTATGKTTAPAKKPAECKTEITRAQFEKIASGLSANVTPQLKRQLEQQLPRFMAMSEIATKKGLEKSPRVIETMKIAKMQILTGELQRETQDEADKVPQATIEEYYKSNPEAYEQFSLDRLFIPLFKQLPAEEKEDDKETEKLTDEQQKAKEAADKARQEKGEQELNKLADSLRERAAKGEDFTALQKEAFEAAGQKIDKPTVNLPKVRRTGLPPAHAAVFELKVSEVSAVISDNGGHYIYKVVSKEVLPLDQVKDEIHNKLKSERLKEMMDKYTNSFQAVPNEAYFGPATAAGPPARMRGPQGPRPMTPMQAAPQQNANPPAQSPAATPPPSKPN